MSTLTLRHGASRIGRSGFAYAVRAPRRNGLTANGAPWKPKRPHHRTAARFERKLAFTSQLWTPTGRAIRCTVWRKSSRPRLDS